MRRCKLLSSVTCVPICVLLDIQKVNIISNINIIYKKLTSHPFRQNRYRESPIRYINPCGTYFFFTGSGEEKVPAVGRGRGTLFPKEGKARYSLSALLFVFRGGLVVGAWEAMLPLMFAPGRAAGETCFQKYPPRLQGYEPCRGAGFMRRENKNVA